MPNLSKLIYLAISLLALLPFSLMAQNVSEVDGEITASYFLEKNNELKSWCDQNPLVVNVKVFKSTRDKAKSLRNDFCNKNIHDYSYLQSQIVELLGDLKTLFPDSNQLSKLFLENIRKEEWVRINATGEVAQFEVLDDGPVLAISLDNEVPGRIQSDLLKQCDTSAKSIASESDCKAALKEFEIIYNYAHSTLAQPLAFELSQRLSLLETRWNEYYSESKSQTIWELALNGALFQKENNEHEFAKPPSWQLVFMHPNIVIENVGDAIDGDQLKEAVMIEAIGADWWKQDKWFLPSGGAFIATYSDRSDVNDWGYGVSLNFDSKFTLGASDHGGDIGFFITIDFLKLIQDKTSTIKKYRDSAEF